MEKIGKLVDALTALVELGILALEYNMKKDGMLPVAAAASEAAEAPQKHRIRRTKAELEAANAAHEAAEQAKAAGQAPAIVPAAAAAATGSADPLGDFGSAAATAVGDDKGGASAPAKEEPPALPVLDEKQSYEKLVLTMHAFTQLAKNDTPDGLTQLRTLIVSTFKTGKVKDLVHAQRLEAIALVSKMIAGYKKPAAKAPEAAAAEVK